VCHEFLNDPRFYSFQLQIDHDIANQVRQNHCHYCGDVLHRADYPRKPRGLRKMITEDYKLRFSFCCARDGCRRRNTPGSIRFLGPKVYLGFIIVLVTALEHGLSNKRRQYLIEQLDISPQTFYRWKKWWIKTFSCSRCWKERRGSFIPPLETQQFPGAILGRLSGQDLIQRLYQFLQLLLPITSTSCSSSVKVVLNPQKM